MTKMPQQGPYIKRAYLLLPLAALLAVVPLMLYGCSCGHDFDFHLQSWLDAAQQLRHGTLMPHWTFSAAYNAGEPRFVFYPPLSWLLGALLTLAFPIAAVPVIYTWLALTAAGFAMYHLARIFASPNAALLASLLYAANPYMLFNAFERTAYAELLAAAWMPLLLLTALRERPTVRGIALPVALLWLTNAPAAVMGCYAFAVVIALRILHTEVRKRRLPATPSAMSYFQLLTISAGGAVLGLALPAFYLLPAAYERRYVQIAMAIIPNMRFEDNFLFGHTSDAPHNVVLHTASLLSVGLLLATACILALATLRLRRNDAREDAGQAPHQRTSLQCLAALTLLIAFLLTPASTLLWRYMPELAFLQFPWRMLSVLAVVLALGLALLIQTTRFRAASTTFGAVAAVIVLSAFAIHSFRQPCDATDLPSARAELLRTSHGFGPTDEYTPTTADNDELRADDPPYWLATDAGAAAPGTTPNPAATIPNFDYEPDAAHTVSGRAPMHLVLSLQTPQILVLNLRDYPDWRVTRNSVEQPKHLQRDDGLLAIALPAGASVIDIQWQRTRDQQVGIALSAGALAAFGLTFRRSRKIEV